jgi:hypothetical protein
MTQLNTFDIQAPGEILTSDVREFLDLLAVIITEKLLQDEKCSWICADQ